MTKIRRLYFFDKKNTQEMISFLNNNARDNYINKIMFNPLTPLHNILPLSLKYLPESYVLKDDKEIKALITIAPNNSKNKRMEIQKLFFEENSLSHASELVQFVVSKYKALGATSILVKVDDFLPELLTMFVSRCGFSQISYEKLWRITNYPQQTYNKKSFRFLKNSDSKAVANLYNDSLLPHFRSLLSKEPREYNDKLLKGLTYYNEYKYIVEDEKSKNVIGCILIQTYDNENYIVDIVQSPWCELDINSLLSFAVSRIKKRKKKFGLFIKTKKYTIFGEKYDNIFMENKYECVQNQILLTNSSAKILSNPEKTGKYTILGNFCSSKTLPTT